MLLYVNLTCGKWRWQGEKTGDKSSNEGTRNINTGPVEFPKHNHDFHLLTKHGSAKMLLEYHNFMSNNMLYKN